MSAEQLIASATKTLELEAAGITALGQALEEELGKEFVKAVEIISTAQKKNGRVIISGMGKSGHVGRQGGGKRWPLPAPRRFLCTRQRLVMVIWV